MNFLKVISAITSVIPIVGTVVEIVESVLGPKRGAEKKATANALARMLLGTTEHFRHEDILDDDLFAEGVDLVIEGMVKIANSRAKR